MNSLPQPHFRWRISRRPCPLAYCCRSCPRSKFRLDKSTFLSRADHFWIFRCISCQFLWRHRYPDLLFCRASTDRSRCLYFNRSWHLHRASDRFPSIRCTLQLQSTSIFQYRALYLLSTDHDTYLSFLHHHWQHMYTDQRRLLWVRQQNNRHRYLRLDRWPRLCRCSVLSSFVVHYTKKGKVRKRNRKKKENNGIREIVTYPSTMSWYSACSPSSAIIQT